MSISELASTWLTIGTQFEFVADNFANLRLPFYKIRARRVALVLQLRIHDYHTQIVGGSYSLQEAETAWEFLRIVGALYEDLKQYQTYIMGDFPWEHFRTICFPQLRTATSQPRRPTSASSASI